MVSLKQVQGLPESQRKIVFWVIFILITVLVIGFGAVRIQRKLGSFRAKEALEEIKPPSYIEENLKTDELRENLNELEEFKGMIHELDTNL